MLSGGGSSRSGSVIAGRFSARECTFGSSVDRHRQSVAAFASSAHAFGASRCIAGGAEGSFGRCVAVGGRPEVTYGRSVGDFGDAEEAGRGSRLASDERKSDARSYQPAAMPKADPINRSDELFGAQLLAFKNAIGAYAVVLELSPARVASQAADADFFAYTLASQRVMLNGGRQWTTFKDLLRRGEKTEALTLPAPPAFPDPVPRTTTNRSVRRSGSKARSAARPISPRCSRSLPSASAAGWCRSAGAGAGTCCFST